MAMELSEVVQIRVHLAHLVHLVDVTGFFGGWPTCIWVGVNLHLGHLGGSEQRGEQREETKATRAVMGPYPEERRDAGNVRQGRRKEQRETRSEERGVSGGRGWRAGDEIPPLRCAMHGVVRSVPLRSG